MKYIFIAYIFSVINIHILHYKLSQISNNLTEKSQSGPLCGTEGVNCRMTNILKFLRVRWGWPGVVEI
jgi:hypothetical protein